MRAAANTFYTGANTTFYASSQTATANVPMTLQQNSYGGVVSTPYFERPITITSATAISATNFTVIGLNALGQTISEVISVTGATTSTSTNFYSQLISVTSNATVPQITIGVTVVANSKPLFYSYSTTGSKWAVQTVVGGTINYTVEITLDPACSASSTWVAVPYVTTVTTGALVYGLSSGLTANAYISNDTVFSGIRFRVTSGTNPTINFYYSQQGLL